MVLIHSLGQWYLIVDLSSSEGYSVNSVISKILCALSYFSVTAAMEVVVRMDLGTLLAEVDIRNAYCMLPKMTGGC